MMPKPMTHAPGAALRAARAMLLAAVMLATLSPPSRATGAVTPMRLLARGAAPFTETVRDMAFRDALQGVVPGPRSASQAPGTGFPGISLADQFAAFGSGKAPPDASGAVGQNHFMLLANGSAAIYQRDGTRLSHVSLNSFFTVTNLYGTYPHGDAFCPRILYDRRVNRWFACALETNAGASNNLLVAVSRTGDPTGAWSKWAPFTGMSSYFASYVTLGMDSNGLYAGIALSQISFLPPGGMLVSMYLPGLLAASPTMGSFLTVDTLGGFLYPQPAHNLDAVAANASAWVVSPSGTPGANVTYRLVQWTYITQPTVSALVEVTTPAFGAAPNAPALGTPADKPVSTGDARIQSAVVHGNRLWLSRTVGVNSTGGATGADRSACEWLLLNVSTASASLLDSGRVYDSSATDPRFYYQPSLMVNGQGLAAMGFAGSRAAEYIGAYGCARPASYPPGTMGAPLLVRGGLAPYCITDGAGTNRWGDYSGASLDPRDDMTIWLTQEYAADTNVWGTWITPWLAPPPTLDTPDPLPRVLPGTVGAALDLTGADLYDPGAGFPNRIGATISGDGISNLAVAYHGPGSVTLTFDVAEGAALSARDITITNPDGQSAVLVGVLRVEGTPVNVATEPVSGRVFQQVTLAATLTRAEDAAPIAGETLEFALDAVPAGVATTGPDGRATLAYVIPIGSGAGTREISARHIANAHFGASEDAKALTVSKGNTALSFYAASGVLGGVTTLRAMLSSSGRRVPGRQVAFAVDGTPCGSATTDASGIAARAYNVPDGLGASTHNVTATFDGSADSAFVGSTRTAPVLTVSKKPTGFSLYAATGRIDSTALLKAMLLCGSTKLVGKTVAFAVDGAPVGTGVTDANGTASYTYSIPWSSTVGTHNVTASFDGSADSTYNSSSRTAAVLTVTKANTAFSLYAATGPLGGNATLKAMLLSGSTKVVGRTVTFQVEGVAAGSGVTDANGVASVQYTLPIALGTGLHNVTASFAGDATYNPTSRTAAVLTCTKVVTSLSLYAASGTAGQTVTLKCILMGAGARLVGKSVAFAVDGVPASSGVTDGTGTASVLYPIPLGMGLGPHNVTATFDGTADPTYGSTTRTAAALTVR